MVLSEEDQVVDSKAVRRYLTGEESLRWARDGLEVMWYPGLDHATVWDTKERRKPMLEIVRRFTMIASGGSASSGPVDALQIPTTLGA